MASRWARVTVASCVCRGAGGLQQGFVQDAGGECTFGVPVSALAVAGVQARSEGIIIV